ncbi:MAG: hypothetical protein CM1200mP41_31710 [Gammaproteobacteria bacterium]|nr:MAG: hypothetical protein CM1200mP41_31710 [Gammaproteobacteria bacterium]
MDIVRRPGADRRRSSGEPLFLFMVRFQMTFSCALGGLTDCSIDPMDPHGRTGTFAFAAKRAQRDPRPSSFTAQVEIEFPIRHQVDDPSPAQSDHCQRYQDN